MAKLMSTTTPYIDVTIHKDDGTITVAPQGFLGKRCKEVSKFLEDALGLDDKKSKPTGEMFQTETASQKVRT